MFLESQALDATGSRFLSFLSLAWITISAYIYQIIYLTEQRFMKTNKS
jgi:hypothetical protein